MAKRRSIYACSECGAQQPRWLGRCPDCGAWDSLVEEPLGGKASGGGLVGAGPGLSGEPTPLSEIQPDASPRIQTGEPELDRVLAANAARADEVADRTLNDVYDKLGLLRRV